MTRDQKVQKAKDLHNKFLHERANGLKHESLITEREYLIIRKELIDEVTTSVTSKKSITMSELEAKVLKREKPKRRETGIRVIDMELVAANKYGYGNTGGFTLGNFIQLAGQRGAGKSTLLMKILTGFSNYEQVSWFDFEMGDEKAVEAANQFKKKSNNINYYDGSREINDIVDEIKFLYADGVRHFVIDSMMKINSKEHKRGYESFSYISSVFAELTSSLGVNIYLINQISQESTRNNQLMMKHGNDAEYDADYLFYLIKKDTGEKDAAGQVVFDDNVRLLVCSKNRVDHRLFSVEITKSDLFGAEVEEYEYEEN